jgi:hypothetical protein
MDRMRRMKAGRALLEPGAGAMGRGVVLRE